MIKNNSTIGLRAIVRLYYTQEELGKLVTDFNAGYNLDKTITDIQFVRYFQFNLNDHSVQNNVNNPGSYQILDATLHPYGEDYYFERYGSAGNAMIGEIRPVLLTGENLNVNDLKASKCTIYPNPATSSFNVQTPFNTNIDKIIIRDLAGKQLIQKANSTQLNINELAASMYIVEIDADGYKFQRKIIKN